MVDAGRPEQTTQVSRRVVLATGAAVATQAIGPVRAQVTSPALACPAPPAFAALSIEGTGAPAGTVAVFAHPFRPGDVPRGARLAARAADGGGAALPAQLNVISVHADGSARLGVVALAVPALAPGRRLAVWLSAVAAAPPESPLDLANALEARQVVVTIEGGGVAPWRRDLAAAVRDGLAAPGPWQSGPLAAQARLVMPVPPATAGGAASLRLVADVSARRDGTVWVDAWLRNDVAMRPGGGAASYAAVVVLDGRQALGSGPLRHHQYTGWGRLLGAGPGRGTPAARPPLVRHDPGYLADAGAAARYDTSLAVDERLLAGFAAAVAEPAWAAPLGARRVAQYMPSSGDRDDIGAATMAQATWLVTGDARAAAYAVGQAEAAGSIPWHLWDPSGGSGEGGWLDVRRWPRLWADGRGGAPPGGLAQPPTDESGWTPDTAHQPDLSLVPFLLTGRRAFLDNLQAQAAWDVVSHWHVPRGNGDALVVRDNQVRGAAWSMRAIGNAAWASRDADPAAGYFRAVLAGNWRWIRAQIPVWTGRQGEAHGWIPGAYGTAGALPPWQQDHFAMAAALGARRGDADARAVLDWMVNFLAGRFLAGPRGFDPRDGAAYLIAISPEATPERPYDSWAAIGAATRARGLSNAGGWARSDGNYGQLALQSLSELVDITGADAARRAYAWLLAAGAPYTRLEDYERGPKHAVAPRGQERGARRGGSCSAPAESRNPERNAPRGGAPRAG